MSPNSQFWLNFSAQSVAALATLVAALVALFGPKWQRLLFPPKLALRLLNTVGEKTTVPLEWTDEAGTKQHRMEAARFYHVEVKNASAVRWPPATGVELHLQLFQDLGPDGRFHTTWNAVVPMRRRFQEFLPLTATIGSPADYDLCCVVKGKWLELCPLIVPNNLQARWRQAVRFRVQLQARSVEIDSNPALFEIAWDGEWSDDSAEMSRHLVIKQIEQ